VYFSLIKSRKLQLNKLFDIQNEEVLAIVVKVIGKGWWVFAAVVALLSLSSPVFFFAALSFLSNPAGIVVVALLGVGAAASLRVLYRNRELPLAIKDIGSKYKPKYEKIISGSTAEESRRREIDELTEEAIVSLVSTAKRLSTQERLDLEKRIKRKIFFWSNPSDPRLR